MTGTLLASSDAALVVHSIGTCSSPTNSSSLVAARVVVLHLLRMAASLQEGEVCRGGRLRDDTKWSRNASNANMELHAFNDEGGAIARLACPRSADGPSWHLNGICRAMATVERCKERSSIFRPVGPTVMGVIV